MNKIELIGQYIDVYNETLENGLKVYLVPYTNKNNYYITCGTKFGSINLEFTVDGKKKKVPAGVAHFLEHKMFETADGKNPFDFFSKSGSSCNASTGYQKTRYLVEGNKNIEENLEYFLSYINGLYCTDELVEKEKGIIIEELKMYQNNPAWQIDHELSKSTFDIHPIKIDIGGTIESVKATTKEDLYTCYNAFYQPSNMVLAVAGNFDRDKILEIIKKHPLLNSRIEKVKVGTKKPNEKEKIVTKKKTISIPTLTVPKLALAVKTKVTDYQSLPVFLFRSYTIMIANILYDQSALFREEMLRKKLMTSLNSNVLWIDDILLMEFNADTDKPEELAKEIVNHFKNTKITSEELERYKKVWISSSIYGADSISTMANNIVNVVLEYDELIEEHWIESIRSMNIEDLEKIRNIINIDNTTAIIANPTEKTAKNEDC